MELMKIYQPISNIFQKFLKIQKLQFNYRFKLI